MTESNPFRELPSVREALDDDALRMLIQTCGRETVSHWLARELERLRGELRDATALPRSRTDWIAELAVRLQFRLARWRGHQLGRVLNATGIVLHTGLGRAPLAPAAVEAVREAASAVALEVDPLTGEREPRGFQIVPMLRHLTGCEAALVVNNNAAATLLALAGAASGKEVLISRGQLIEIGGSFRLPDIFALSGARLREVGTTNRTRAEDYAAAIGPATGAILHVHPSNFRTFGFVESPDVAALIALARRYGVPFIDDIGSGALRDVTRLGLPPEPTFADSIAGGADLVLGSGDKLLGGPQAGIILGRSDRIESLRRHPFARTARVDKLTLAALAATLAIYARGAERDEIPLWRLLTTSVAQLRSRASDLSRDISAAHGWTCALVEGSAPVGGGSLPGCEQPTVALAVARKALSARELAERLRTGEIPVYARIVDDRVLLDLRGLFPEDDRLLTAALFALDQ